VITPTFSTDHHLHSKMYTTLATVLAIAAATVGAASTDACAPQPQGYGPVPSPNTDTAFASSNEFASAANNAATPALYQRVFTNTNGSEFATSSNVYLGYYELKSYDPNSCTAICDKTSGCVGTNLYFERSPSLLPAASCPNPAAITVRSLLALPSIHKTSADLYLFQVIKCGLWGSPVTAAQATNYGQWQADFHVVIAGSNGYMKLPSQACSAISSAWSGNSYSMPTGSYNWQGWTSSYGNRFATSAWPSTATAGPTGYAMGGPRGYGW